VRQAMDRLPSRRACTSDNNNNINEQLMETNLQCHSRYRTSSLKDYGTSLDTIRIVLL